MTYTANLRAPAGHRDIEGETASAAHDVDHPGREAALTPAQRAAAVQAHQQAAMPVEYLEGRTTDPATWLRTPKNLERLAAHGRAAEARRRSGAHRVESTEWNGFHASAEGDAHRTTSA
ncbi:MULTISPECIES: hypothetical protein [unclassified Streptomyces]|uniref:hypothetical protein n=1 Tax=unclassified Streptomyces TaxID=2593676 RepID=UPI00039DAB27|nr:MULTISPECIES: hypothetical protein [unclassified Streptomyces]